ncbi:MAG: LuxR C-terminal-related transcriptional regulator [Gemmatimonadota bacterium]|nr:LuxR C-terminal-related transcriptional regulator [Gemmatimonadota bacterium]
MSSGRSNKSIGHALGISPRTAGTHLTNLYRKLGVASRAQLMALAHDNGWLEESPGYRAIA